MLPLSHLIMVDILHSQLLGTNQLPHLSSRMQATMRMDKVNHQLQLPQMLIIITAKWHHLTIIIKGTRNSQATGKMVRLLQRQNLMQILHMDHQQHLLSLMVPQQSKLLSKVMEPQLHLVLMELPNLSPHLHMQQATVNLLLLPLLLMVIVLIQVIQVHQLFSHLTIKQVIHKRVMASSKKVKLQARHRTRIMDKVGTLQPKLLLKQVIIRVLILQPFLHHKRHLKQLMV